MMYERERSYGGRPKITSTKSAGPKHVKQTDSGQKVHTSAAIGFPKSMRTVSLCRPVCLSLGLSLCQSFFLRSGTIFVSLSVHFMPADAVHDNLDWHEPSPVAWTQKQERLTVAGSVDVFWGYHVGALRATCVNSLVCRCCGTHLREKPKKKSERRTQKPPLPRRGSFTLTGGSTAFDHDLHLHPLTWSCFLNKFVL